MTEYRQMVREIVERIKGDELTYADMARMVDK